MSDIVLDRACAIRVQTSRGSVIFFVSVYLPAQGSREPLDASLDDVTESQERGAHVIILGDFNGDVGNLGPRGICDATSRGGEVMTFFLRHGLIPINMQDLTERPVNTYEGAVNGSTLRYLVLLLVAQLEIGQNLIPPIMYLLVPLLGLMGLLVFVMILPLKAA